MLQNKEKKHRTLLYAFIVTDLLDEWEDAKVMGKALSSILFFSNFTNRKIVFTVISNSNALAFVTPRLIG